MSAADLDTALAGCTGPDDPAFRAAELLADAWQPALAASYRHGFEDGFAAGVCQAERDAAQSWAAATKAVREVLAAPTREELVRRRVPA